MLGVNGCILLKHKVDGCIERYKARLVAKKYPKIWD